MLYNYNNEHAALLTLLRIDGSHTSWIEIANRVLQEKSATRILEHKIDPSIKLLDIDDEYEEYKQDTLFQSIPTDDEVQKITNIYNQAVADLADWKRQELQFLSVLDQDFPQRLATVIDTPPFLFAKGTLKSNDTAVSVVGSRRCTPEGAQFAHEVARMLVNRGITVIAGLAEGIDTAAHRSALKYSGRTVAFIGTGINRYYPRSNKMLQQEIEHKGLVLSQFYPDANPTRQSFPMRNALMSGYGIATVVVEASEHSGTRIQARQAQHHGRPLILHRQVVENTQWGKQYEGKPGVFVVNTVEDVANALDFINEMNNFDINALVAQIQSHDNALV